MKDKNIYAWVPWFQELARKIADGGKEDLAAKAAEVSKLSDVSDFSNLLNPAYPAIDPFSFLYILAGRNTKNYHKRVFSSVSTVYSISSKMSFDFPIVQSHGPILPGPTQGPPAFHNKNKKDGNPDLLWNIFRCAIDGVDDMTSDDFHKVFAIKNVATQKFTQSLFLTNPKAFMPVDSGTHQFSSVIDLDTYEDAKKKIEQENGLEYYKIMLSKFHKAFPNCEMYEINTALFLLKEWEKNDEGNIIGNKFFQVSANAHGYDSPSHWDKFSKWNCVYTGARGRDIPFGSKKITGKLYPIKTPECGDIILVRTGWKKGLEGGRAIGVVYENEYAKKELADHDASHADSAIHVLWLNKGAAKLAANTARIGFSNAPIYREAYNAFSNADEYDPTFLLIDHLKERGMKKRYLDKLTPLPENKVTYPHNQILYGPPGTGKTWNTINHALAITCGIPIAKLQNEEHSRKWLLDFFNVLKQDKKVEMVTFHQSFTYEDFVEGIRPVLGEDDDGSLDYEIVDGVFKRISKQAEDDPDKKYVLIIDEINRGNIAKIFGELITLIESTKRLDNLIKSTKQLDNHDQASVTLPYSGDDFGVPDNLYIIGTMNTADRSIALLDTALRRRFDFIEMMPDLTLVSEDVAGINCRQLLKIMNQRITDILDRDHQLGHSYFMPIIDMDTIANAFQNRIIPLLQEYFYDDRQKIRLVLNHNAFMTKRDIRTDLLRNTDLIDTEQKIYDLIDKQHDAWKDPANYIAIYSSSTDTNDTNNTNDTNTKD